MRVLWLLEELGLDYEVVPVSFEPTSSTFFQQQTPTGKLPVLEDGDVVLGESGAILQYLLERYGDGRLQPSVDSPSWPEFLYWFHYAESTAFAPIGVVVWLRVYRQDAEEHPDLTRDAVGRARRSLEEVDRHLAERQYLLGNDFSAADVMMGFTIFAAGALIGLEGFDHLQSYVTCLQQRPALQKAMAVGVDAEASAPVGGRQ